MIIRLVWDKELSPVWLTKFIVVLAGVLVLVLCSLTVHSEWEDHAYDVVKEVVYSVDTIQAVKCDYWLDQADRDSVQVIFKEEYYTFYTESGPNYNSLGIGGKTDSVFYDTIRYYRR